MPKRKEKMVWVKRIRRMYRPREVEGAVRDFGLNGEKLFELLESKAVNLTKVKRHEYQIVEIPERYIKAEKKVESFKSEAKRKNKVSIKKSKTKPEPKPESKPEINEEDVD